jgi:hypothetical protein
LEAVEGLVQQLFNPAVAFTSAPLNENDNPIPIINTLTEATPLIEEKEEDTNEDEKAARISATKSVNMIESYYMVPSPDGTDDPMNFQQGIAIKTSSTPLEREPEKRYGLNLVIFKRVSLSTY